MAERRTQNEDLPPYFGSWPKLYVFVLMAHGVVITLFYLFTRYLNIF